MSGTAFLSTSSLSLRKVVLIKVLVVVLAFVLFGREQASPESDVSRSPQSTREITQAALQPETASDHLIASWPEFSLQSVLRVNPFETILVTAPQPQFTKDLDPQRTAAKSAQELTSSLRGTTESDSPAVPVAAQQRILERRPHDNVDIIYENETERVAVIDSRLVRVGDVLSDGRVVAITPNHVIIEAVPFAD